MQEGLDATINERVGNDLHVNTHEERKGGDQIDVSKLSMQKTPYLIFFELQINLLSSWDTEA